MEKRAKQVLAITSGTAFLGFLDVTIVNLAFPDLRRDFAGVSVSELSWVITAYAVVFAALLAPAGRLADLIGRRRIFLIGIGAFTLTSVGSALAPSIETLIVARALQGLAAALMIPAGLGLVLAETPPELRRTAVGVWAAAAGISAAIGPSLSGILVDVFDWRAVFFINLPIGTALLVAGLRVLREVETVKGRLPDLLGTAVLALGLGAAVLGVTQGTDWGWGSEKTLAAVAGGALLVAFALVRSRRHDAPAIETRLWKNRVFAAANMSSVLFGASMYSWMLLCVLFVIGEWHYSILEAGLAVSPGALTAALASVVVGSRAGVQGQRIAVVGGSLVVAAVGVWLVAVLGPEPRFLSIWLPAGLVSGLGMGAVATGLASAAATSVAPAQFAAATGLNMTARQLGGALGIAALAAILEGQPSGAVDPYLDVFLFSSLASVGVALAGLRLVARAPATSPATTGEVAS
jgi:EmrB/QacA subfamily drug resistance transporter